MAEEAAMTLWFQGFFYGLLLGWAGIFFTILVRPGTFLENVLFGIGAGTVVIFLWCCMLWVLSLWIVYRRRHAVTGKGMREE